MDCKLHFLLCILLLVGHCLAYTTFPRSSVNEYNEFNSTSSTRSVANSEAVSVASSCCVLNSWAYEHMDEVRQFANRLRLLFNSMSHGNNIPDQYNGLDIWKANIIELTGKKPVDLNALSVYWAKKLIADMRSGATTYNTIAKPNFFEFKAAEILKSYADLRTDFDVSQRMVDVGSFQPLDLTDFDEVKNYAYPAEVKVINGKTYVVRKNCTEATKTMGDGTLSSPLITVLKRNRTIVTSGGSGYPSNNMYYPPGHSSSSVSMAHKSNIYDWVNSNMEPSVVDYQPMVSIGSEWSSHNINRGSTYEPMAHVSSYRPESTVTVHRYNETVIRNSDGIDSVSGSEINRKWIDGRLVYDQVRPFGDRSITRDEAWKREERERLFWFLNGGTTVANLEEWQRQQEERLLAMAQRYHISVENIQEWHLQELERFKQLLKQYQVESGNALGWRGKERGRLDWLIHQNSLTREELERWQRENQDRLQHLANNYGISLGELKSWQTEELDRLYIVFQKQNESMIPSGSLYKSAEQERLEALIREHNATIAQLQNSIQVDQRKLNEFRQNYHGNVQDLENWLKSEVSRISGIISEQRNELTRITEWQNSERQRLENLLRAHRGSIAELEAQMATDRNYIQSLASKYHISIEELEKWQKSELDRLQNESKTQLEQNVKAWQAREHENLMSIIRRNDLSIEDFQSKILNDRARLEDLARTYKVQVSEVEDWFKQELKNFQTQGLLKEVEKELAAWQQQERQRLLAIVQKNALSMEELEQKIKNDQSQLYSLANTYQIRVEELEEWLKKEFLRLQNQGLVKVQDLKDWQRAEREHIMELVKQNKLTIEEFEQRLLKDRARLQNLSKNYNVQRSEVEEWIHEEGKRLQQLGLLQMQEQLNQWQQIERERLRSLVEKNKLTLEELEARISQDQTHLYSLAHQHQVRVEEVESWIKNEIKKLQEQGLLEMAKLKDWQTEWRGNLTNMLEDRDFTVEEFHKWLLDDRSRLQSLAKVHNVQIEEMEHWVQNEEDRFVSLGLLKPNEKLTNWQEVERRYLERITQEQQYRSTEQLEQRLRQDRELLEQLARQYSVQVEEIQHWMKKELSRLRDEGQLQIDNLTAWQLAERERLEALTKAKKEWNLQDLEATLKNDREHMQKLAFQYHTSMEEIEKWLKSEISRLQQQGKIEIKTLTDWQQAEQNRIMNLLANQSSITAAEFERKVQQDYSFLQSLANEYHVSVMDVEAYVAKVVEELQQKGKFEVQNLQTWQLVERDYIKQLIAQYNNELSTTEFEQKLRADRAHIQQLSAQYRINAEQIEKWMLEELGRLRSSSETGMKQLSEWQENEVVRLKKLLQENQQLDYVSYEMELMKERERLENLSREYAVSVEQIEEWLRQQLLNLKTNGQIQVESLTKWQADEQKRLIELLLQQQQNRVSFEEFESQLRNNQSRLQQLSTEYSINVEQIEQWMRDELQRLQTSGLVQVEHLNSWQQAERARLEQWLRQLDHNVSYTELLDFLKRDERRLQEIAHEYQITVEEVESWVQMEAARLQFLNSIRQPDHYSEENRDTLWKVHTRAHLRGIAQAKPMSWEDFEQYLKRERMRWQQLAFEYNVTVEEIEQWLRQSAQELRGEGLIQDTVTNEAWQINEQLYIQNLLNEALRKNHERWTIEELEYWLKQDKARLQQIADNYHLAVETIEAWYERELQRLLSLKKIMSSLVNDWQRRERLRIYGITLNQPSYMRTLKHLETILLQNQNELNRLATEYHITIEELVEWIKSELRRLVNLGILTESGSQIVNNNWHTKERSRLRTIASELSITESELLDFIAGDVVFQKQLSQNYGCSLDQLAPFQRIEISSMQKEHLFENRNLISLTPWQVKERDRIYSFIKNQNLTLKNLKDWQRQDIYINELAAKYGIDATTLKNWQLQEYERLMKLAAVYRMSLYQLQDFREKELLRMSHVMHKELSTLEERKEWQTAEFKRLRTLQHDSGLRGKALEDWRRKLYLLCQGLIPKDFGQGGYDTGHGSTNVTGLPEQKISKDRGDQPPHVYEENLDGQEPGLEGQESLYPNPPAKIITEPSTTQIPLPYSKPPSGGGMQSGYRYTKQEYKFTSAPVGVATASASADSYGSSASASVMSPGHLHGRRQSGQELDNGQQQVQKETANWGGRLQQEGSRTTYSQNQQQQFEDFGQQEQQTDDWGQQVEQVENYSSKDQGQQQQQFEDFGQQQQVELENLRQHTQDSTYGTQSAVKENIQMPTTVVKAELAGEPEQTGFWSNIKKKTTDLFG